jgi:Protein of unknown function (DUF1453)
MQSSPDTPAWVAFVPFVVVAIILVVRMVRPQRISVTRMWISPIILSILMGWSIYASEVVNPAPVWEVVLGIVIGLIAGAPFGYLRGLHTDVRPADRPGVMYLGSSWTTAAVFLGAFGLRFGVRALMPHRGSLAGAAGDAVLAFAVAFIVTSYVVIFRKYEAEIAKGSPPVTR